MAKLKIRPLIIIIAVVLIAVIVGAGLIIKDHLSMPKCKFCGSRDGVAVKYGVNICANCDEGMQDENNTTIVEGNLPENFTNKFGTNKTLCHRNGCKETIAFSGNTKYCETHSEKCRKCGEYINAGTTLCEDCKKNLLKK